MNNEDIYYYSDGTISNKWNADKILHRVDGPAIEGANGDKFWCIDDKEYTKRQFNKLIKEVNQMSVAMKLIDPRWWVRELGEKEVV